MVEEVWAEHLKAKLSENDSHLTRIFNKVPTFVEAILLSKELKIPLHPNSFSIIGILSQLKI